jgi:hypothetical protein
MCCAVLSTELLLRTTNSREVAVTKITRTTDTTHVYVACDDSTQYAVQYCACRERGILSVANTAV